MSSAQIRSVFTLQLTMQVVVIELGEGVKLLAKQVRQLCLELESHVRLALGERVRNDGAHVVK